MKDEYILIKDVMARTGLSAQQLINKSLNGHFTFYYFSSADWQPVNTGYLEEMYHGRLNVQYSYRKQLDGERDHLDLDMLHIRTKDIEKLSRQVGMLTLPDEHRYIPKGLKVAMECWIGLFGDAGDECENIKKEQIHKWIEAKYPSSEISKSFREEIAKVVNPFPEGGKPKKNLK